MLPPPLALYYRMDKLFQSAQTFANSQDYAYIKKKIHKDCHGKLKSMLLHCDQGSTYSTEACYRQTISQLIDCKFKLKAFWRDSFEHNGLPYAHILIQHLEKSEDGLELLLQNQQNRYQIWLEHQQTAIQESLNNIINATLVNLQNPQMV
ncbi:26488_t:CDS:2 [Gigaspora margarita]|uniref:26488_t:CDS:1 n=1 Tax=Gigaspora margarita TaxID=4874 RepID=A0ABM8W4Z3_GIGMA|nr:26488_t:CDS:2 [Gigaspora margarita]